MVLDNNSRKDKSWLELKLSKMLVIIQEKNMDSD